MKDGSVAGFLEHITSNGETLAYIIRAEIEPRSTTFVTPPVESLQMGFVVYPAGGEIPRHEHQAIERSVKGTPEAIFIRKGRCEVDLYNGDRELVATRELRAGDVVLIRGAGHRFRIIEDTIFLEIKQGPYTGESERERF